MIRTISLPAINQTVSLKQYLDAVRLAKQNPNLEFKHGLTCWWPCTGREIVKQFWEGCQDRINQSISYSERGFEKLTPFS
jgi:hypothetical protein